MAKKTMRATLDQARRLADQYATRWRQCIGCHGGEVAHYWDRKTGRPIRQGRRPSGTVPNDYCPVARRRALAAEREGVR